MPSSRGAASHEPDQICVVAFKFQHELESPGGPVKTLIALPHSQSFSSVQFSSFAQSCPTLCSKKIGHSPALKESPINKRFSCAYPHHRYTHIHRLAAFSHKLKQLFTSTHSSLCGHSVPEPHLQVQRHL